MGPCPIGQETLSLPVSLPTALSSVCTLIIVCLIQKQIVHCADGINYRLESTRVFSILPPSMTLLLSF